MKLLTTRLLRYRLALEAIAYAKHAEKYERQTFFCKCRTKPLTKGIDYN